MVPCNGRRRSSFEIAGIRFRLTGRSVPFALPPSYASFRTARYRGPGRLTSVVDVRIGGPLAAPTDPICRTDSWTLAHGEDYLLALAPPAMRGRAWLTARFPPGLARVDVTIADASVDPIAYPVDQVLVMHLLAAHGGCILHAAGFGIGRRGFAFCGCSGAGKTTLSLQIRGCAGWRPLSDDRVIVRPIEDGYRIFGTPWPGEGEIAENRSHPLEGIVFLRHAKVNRLAALPPKECLRRLLPVASIPWYDRAAMDGVLGFLDGLAARVPAWELGFRPDGALPAFLRDSLP